MIRNCVLILILLLLCNASNVPKIDKAKVSFVMTGTSFNVETGRKYPDGKPQDFICRLGRVVCQGLGPEVTDTHQWICVDKKEISETIQNEIKKFKTDISAEKEFSTECHEVKTIDPRVFNIIKNFNPNKVIQNHQMKDKLGYCVAFENSDFYQVYQINFGADINIDNIVFPTGKLTTQITYKSIVCGEKNDIENAIKNNQKSKKWYQNYFFYAVGFILLLGGTGMILYFYFGKHFRDHEEPVHDEENPHS